MKRIAIGSVLSIGVAGRAGISAQDQQLAQQGLIRNEAPVRADAEIVVDAPTARVGALLLDLRGWPSWQPEIGTASITNAAQVGSSLIWSNGQRASIQRSDATMQLDLSARVLADRLPRASALRPHGPTTLQSPWQQ